MQAQTQAGADIAPPGKVPVMTVPTANGQSQVLQIPTSHEEMMALVSRRRQLSDQLTSVTDRRDNLIEQLRTVPEAAQQGLESQLRVLDGRVLQLETDLATTGREIAAASPELMSMAGMPDGPPDPGVSFDNGVGAGVAGTLGAIAVLAFLFRKRWWRKGARRHQPALPAADSERLERLENGMEAMAIEIERISEGQRFVTKLLSESRGVEPAPR